MFIGQHRTAFDTEDFRAAFSNPFRTARFLETVLVRYEVTATAYIKAPVPTPDLETNVSAVEDALHLEIESCYLFGNVFVDHLAHATEQCFGDARGLPIGRHSKLERNLWSYARARGMSRPPDYVLRMASRIEHDISEYRDKVLVHPGDASVVFTTVRDDSGNLILATTPTEPWRMRHSGDCVSPNSMAMMLDGYCEGLLHFLAENMFIAVDHLNDRATRRAERHNLGPERAR